MGWIATAIILACFGVGSYFEYFSDKIDAPAEQVAESVLEKENIKYDFSAKKKEAKASKEQTSK